MTQLQPRTGDILRQCRIESNCVFLPLGQLPRPDYDAVNKVLCGIGGKWNRGKGGHVFATHDPNVQLAEMLESGKPKNINKEIQFYPTPAAVVERLVSLASLQLN